MFCLVLLGGSVETILRVKRSFGVILVIFGHFCKTEKARIGAISWTEIGSVWAALLMFKKLARWHPMQTNYLRFKFHDSIASYRLKGLSEVKLWVFKSLLNSGKIQNAGLSPSVLSEKNPGSVASFVYLSVLLIFFSENTLDCGPKMAYILV